MGLCKSADIKLIVAMTKDKVIGKNGDLPWHIPSDLKHFKSLTNNTNVLMGRNTFLSLNRVDGLPNRKNIVLSSSEFNHGDSVSVMANISDAIEFVSNSLYTNVVYVIGGGLLYKSVLDADIINEMHISEIKGEYDGDTYFPSFDESKWELTHCEDKEDFFYKVLTRKR